MDLSSVSMNVQSSLVQQVGASQASCGSSSTASTESSSVTNQINLSKPAEMFSELSSLATSDPTKFKALASQIADKLKSAAQNETGESQKMLNDLATKFENAAQTGDPSGLKPAAHHGHHHHGGHGHGGGAPAPEASDSSSSTSQSARGVDAYKQQGRPELSDGAKNALDSIFQLVQQAVSGSSTSSSS